MNGMETNRNVRATDNKPRPARLKEVGTQISHRNANPTLNPSRVALQAIWHLALLGSLNRPSRYTCSAPAVIPNIAMEIAMKAKWYHMVTLKIRVKRISNIRVARVMRNRPV
jgi:hypothetical protein